MDEPRPAPTLRLALDDDGPEPSSLPVLEPDPEVRVAVERERYDEQILAALVFP